MIEPKFRAKKDAERRVLIEFLLKEYEHTQQLCMHKNQQVEQRVKFYYTLISLAFGVTGALFKANLISLLDPFVGVVLVILLFIGHTVYDRVLMKDVQVRKHYGTRIAIQDNFRRISPDLGNILETQRRMVKEILRYRTNFVLSAHREGSSMRYVVATVNSILVSLVSLYLCTAYLEIDSQYAALVSLILALGYLRLIHKYGVYISKNQLPWKYL